MDTLRAELHCHNEFSNFHLGQKETPYDCGITVQEQLEQVYSTGLDVFFITNHNTLDGYEHLLHYKENHEKFRHIQIYPGEEITTDQGIHILAYGLTRTIKSGQSLEEILDIIRSQGAISCAPHPFALNNGLREKSILCDLIEVFNSNNVDRYSNLRASNFAKTNNMIEVAGSDSHVVSTLGRCVNVIEAENTLDSILQAMRKGRITIDSAEYITCSEMIEHARYKIKNSKDDIMMYFKENHPHLTGICSFLIDAFESNPNSMVWKAVYKVAVHLTTKLSNKINFENKDYNILYERNLRAILPMILT
ncbi:MAG: PHP domain-containing protein [Thaumarchaeota archaeon]|nr:PHP domain-containing protein [Nitrososphaerota archaeon]MDE1866632.1 PHP domain-containing protein [Nitrososphaerota archaeon]